MKTDRTRYLFLDGLRGLAAIYVVVFHAKPNNAIPEHQFAYLITRAVDAIFDFGPYAVVMFIVLSGFCLMLPVANSASGELRGGIPAFAKRRARRILPPYYAALAFTMLIAYLVPSLFQWEQMRAPYSTVDVLSHLLVAHNFFPKSILRIDPPMWSVATECDLYVLFPLLLLPAFRRTGIWGLTAFSIVVGVVPHFVLGTSDALIPWMFTAFGFGAVAAVIVHQERYAVRCGVWRNASIVFLLMTVAAHLVFTRRGAQAVFAAPILFGAASASLIGYLASLSQVDANASIVRMLECRPVVFLGVISYSLYLIHFPVLAACSTVLVDAKIAGFFYWLLMITGGVVMSLMISYVFHCFFERPWMAHAPKTLKAAAQVAVIEPAP